MNKTTRCMVLASLLAFLFTALACGPAVLSPRLEIAQMEDDPFLKVLKPYYAQDERVEDLGREAPEPGYLSEVEVLKQAADYYLRSGQLELKREINYNGVDILLDQSWLLETKVHKPILVHNFNPQTTSDRPNGYDYFYILHASHPVMGSVLDAVYVYNENSGNERGFISGLGPATNYRAHEFYQVWEQTNQFTSHRITQREARQFFEQQVGETLRADPVAIYYPYKGPMSEFSFHWYFETKGERSGGTPVAYVMDSRLKVNSSRDLRDPQAYYRSVHATYAYSGAVAFAGTPMPALLSRLPEPLGIYEALSERDRSNGSRRLRQLVETKTLNWNDFLPVP